MKIQLSRYGGFCYGVEAALKIAYQTRNDSSENIFTLGELIHNPIVVTELREKGILAVENIEEVPENATVVIRAHGAPPFVYKQAKQKNLNVVDATCIDVRKIQKKAELYATNGFRVLIVGQKNHPEIVGIVGWAKDKAIVLSNIEQAESTEGTEKTCLLSQTTASQELFQSIETCLRKKIPNLQVENTICKSTTNRQAEAKQLSKNSDCVIVLGGKQSSNTQKLYDICAKNCERVYLFENSFETKLELFRSNDIISIIAGASTPNWMMMEVVTNMSELEKTVVDESTNAQTELTAEEVANNEFMEAFEKTLVRIRNGQILTGTVVQITDDEVCVNIGYKSDGFIPRSEFTNDPEVRLQDVVKEGDEIEVEVVKVNDGDGNVLLSHKSVMARKAWDEFIEKAEKEDQIFEAVGQEVVKGGLIAYIEGVRTFIPASQVSTRYVENLKEFVGQPLRLAILEIDKSKRRVVASQKKVLMEENNAKKSQIWETLEVGQQVQGIVRRLTDFGAFVDIGGIDGLIHVTEMAWGRVKHPSDVFNIGDEITVVIKSLDREKERISLGYKELQPKPWNSAAERYLVGSIVEGRVVRTVPFGAFVSLEPTIDGLVHISQLDTKRIAKVEDAVKIGDVIRCKVLAVDTEAKRISLSRREVLLEESPIEDIVSDDIEAEEETVIPESEPATTTLADVFPEMED